MSMRDMAQDFGAGVTLEKKAGNKLVLRLHGSEGAGGLFVLDMQSVAALERAMDAIESEARLAGLVVIGDERGFIAGADVKLIQSICDAGVAAEMSRRGQRLFRRFAHWRMTLVRTVFGWTKADNSS